MSVDLVERAKWLAENKYPFLALVLNPSSLSFVCLEIFFTPIYTLLLFGP